MRKGKTAIAIDPLIVINRGFGARCAACGALPHPLDTYPDMELLDYIEVLFYFFEET